MKLTRDQIQEVVDSIRLDELCATLLNRRTYGQTLKMNKDAVILLQKQARIIMVLWNELCQLYAEEGR